MGCVNFQVDPRWPSYWQTAEVARNPADLPKLTVEQVLAWVDAFHERTNKWPRQDSGPIDDAPGETWKGVCMAFVQEQRGLPKGFTLADILAVHRGVRNTGNLPDLSEERILAWADAHHERTGIADSKIRPC